MRNFLFLTALFPLSASGAVGLFGSYVNVTSSGIGVWFDLAPPGGARNSDPIDFEAYDFGAYDPVSGDTLLLTGAEGLTFKNSGGDVTGMNFNYSVVAAGTAHTTFAEEAIGFSNNATFNDAAGTQYTGGGDQKWSDSAGWAPVDVLTGLDNGTYEIQVFLRGTSNEGDFFASNGGSNFTATFTVVPEPSSVLLAMFGGLFFLRRSR